MSTTPMIVDFGADGAVEFMHRENVLDLACLGPQNITRASDLKFDSVTQKWGIWPALPERADGTPGGFAPPFDTATGWPTYEAAREVEIRWFEACRRQGVPPLSTLGEAILNNVVHNLPVA